MRANSALRALPSGLLLSERSWLDEMERRGIPRRVAIANSIEATLAGETAASGDAVATHAAGGKEHQVVMVAHANGHIKGTIPTYTYWRAFAAGAQNQRTIDLFNAAGSGVVVKLRKLFLHHNQATVTGVPHTFDVIHTTAVGTGGTGITGRKVKTSDAAIPAEVTCRFNATGGATESFVRFGIAVHTEETLPATGISPMINWLPEGEDVGDVELAEGEGVLLKQITNSTVGVWGCLLVVTIHAP